MDSGATHHITHDLSLLTDYEEEYSGALQTMSGSNGTTDLPIVGKGTAHLNGPHGMIQLLNVLYVPNACYNLISVQRFVAKQCSVSFHPAFCTVSHINGDNMIIGRKDYSDLYTVPAVRPVTALIATKSGDMSYAHQLFCHPGDSALRQTVRNEAVTGKSFVLANPDVPCEPCMLNKSTRSSFPASGKPPRNTPLALIHVDLMGPVQDNTWDGKRFICLMHDDHSKYAAVEMLESRGDAPAFIQATIVKWENHLSTPDKPVKTKILRSDNAPELIAGTLAAFCKENGIHQEMSVPYTPAQNGKAERMNRTVLTRARTTLDASGLPMQLWGEVISTAVHSCNRLCTAGQTKTPYELFLGHVPDISYMEPFGTLSYVHLTGPGKTKFGRTAVKGYLVGYSWKSKAYRVYVPSRKDSSCIVETADVRFVPGIYYKDSDEWESMPPVAITDFVDLDETRGPDVCAICKSGDMDSGGDVSSCSVCKTWHHVDCLSDKSLGVRYCPVCDGGIKLDAQLPDEEEHAAANETHPARGGAVADTTAGGAVDAVELQRPPAVADCDQTALHQEEKRISAPMKAVSRFADVTTVTAPDDDVDAMQITLSPHGSTSGYYHKPAVSVEDQDSVRVDLMNNPLYAPARALNTALKHADPDTYIQAINGPDRKQWHAACDEEYKNLISRDTFEVVRLPSGFKAIPCKWVLKTKYTATGEVERYKARLVIKGFRQEYGINYDEVFAPVTKHSTFRTALGYACKHDLEIRQLDVSAAFLYGDLEEEIYMSEPEGYASGVPGMACRLKKSLYGLKQAPRIWYQTVAADLIAQGFTASEDPGLFKHYGSGVVILIYVDDFLIIGSKTATDQVIKHLTTRYECRDLGNAEYYLGMHIRRDRASKILILDQRRYIEELLEAHNLKQCRVSSTPITEKITSSGEPITDGKYASIVGALLYLTSCTRPDISYAVGTLARFMSSPTDVMMTAAMKVLRYLSGTSTLGLKFDGNADPTLSAYCDADFGGDLITRRSTTGYCFFAYGGLISWNSKLQPTVAVSSVESEYQAAAATVKEALWLIKLAPIFDVLKPTVNVHCDSMGAIALLKNPISSARSKHIDVIHHFARERVLDGCVHFEYIPTAKQIADVLTKGLPAPKHLWCVQHMNMV